MNTMSLRIKIFSFIRPGLCRILYAMTLIALLTSLQSLTVMAGVVGPAPEELLFDQAILFRPKP